MGGNSRLRRSGVSFMLTWGSRFRWSLHPRLGFGIAPLALFAVGYLRWRALWARAFWTLLDLAVFEVAVFEMAVFG